MQQRNGVLLSTGAAMVWALTSPGIAYLLDVHQVSPLTLAFWRDVFIAVVCVGVLLVVRPGLLRVGLRDLRGFALIGAISIGIYHALWVVSIALNGAAVAIVLIYTFPVFVTLGAWLFFREPIRPLQIVALLLALTGCALLVRVYDPVLLQFGWLGALVGLLTGVTHAGYVLFSQHAVQTHSPWTSLTFTMLFGALTLLVLTLVFEPTQILAVGTTAAPWLALLALSLGPTLGGYALFTAALRHIPGRVASLIVLIEAPIASLIAVLWLGEHLEWLQVLGIGLILCAAVLPQLAMRSPAVTEQPV